MTAFRLSHAARARRLERDKRDRARGTLRHEYGNCGGIYGLCPDCFDDELDELKAWAALQPDPTPGEDAETYWHRIGGRFLDSWAIAASWRMRLERGAA